MEVLEIYGNRKTNKFVSAKRHFIKKKPYFMGFSLFVAPFWHPFLIFAWFQRSE
nr:MAG TPA: hypothetical protein [Caudoviricetes sp.]